MPRTSVSSRIVRHAAKLQKALEEAYNRGSGDVTASVRIELNIRPRTKEELEEFASKSTKIRKAKAPKEESGFEIAARLQKRLETLKEKA